MLGFIKKCFFTGLIFFVTLKSVNSLSCISMNNQECKVRPKIVNVNNEEPAFFPFNIKRSKCSGSCNNINNPHAKLCVSDVFKNLNVKVFDLMSRTNEARHIEWHETCKCKSGLDSSVCNNKHCWNDDKCSCKCKESVEYAIKDPFEILVIVSLNAINNVMLGEYLDYENCKFKEKLVDELIEECTENFEEVKLGQITSMELHLAKNKSKHKCNPCTLYIVLFSMIFKVNVAVGTDSIYFYWFLKRCYSC